ncbi:MAG: selenium cofactor biosynthesis protein YqeC [Candidatus Promineifilaceae bacterium]
MTTETITLPEAFGLARPGQLVAFVGAGGKTSLMFALAQALSGRVVVTTTTRIFAAQMKRAPAVCYLQGEEDDLPDLGQMLSHHGICLVVGQVVGDKALGVPAELPARLLARPDIDHVLVEADGARMLSCKAPAAHEPVIPIGATLVVAVAGIDAVGGRISDVAHRPERVSALTGLDPQARMTTEALATLLLHPEGGLKDVPDAAEFAVFLNKVEGPERLLLARQAGLRVLSSTRVKCVVAGAAQATPAVQEVLRRVTAVVLAAGQSTRMGTTKQLLPWGQTTVLGQTLANLQASAIDDVLVVCGHERESIEAVAKEMAVNIVYNPHFAESEMLSSLQTALRLAAENSAAVLVVLADQPMVEPQTIDLLLEAFWQGKGKLIAPVYQGQRGNPVLIDRSYFPEVLLLTADFAPREILRRHPEALFLVEVGTDSVLRDLDGPEEYDRWRPR